MQQECQTLQSFAFPVSDGVGEATKIYANIAVPEGSQAQTITAIDLFVKQAAKGVVSPVKGQFKTIVVNGYVTTSLFYALDFGPQGELPADAAARLLVKKFAHRSSINGSR